MVQARSNQNEWFAFQDRGRAKSEDGIIHNAQYMKMFAGARGGAKGESRGGRREKET